MNILEVAESETGIFIAKVLKERDLYIREEEK